MCYTPDPPKKLVHIHHSPIDGYIRKDNEKLLIKANETAIIFDCMKVDIKVLEKLLELHKKVLEAQTKVFILQS